jgi:DNA-binding transcriptional regulator YhcF (GntR family)
METTSEPKSYDKQFVEYVESLASPLRIVLDEPSGIAWSYFIGSVSRSIFKISANRFNCLFITPYTTGMRNHWHGLLSELGLPDVKSLDPSDFSSRDDGHESSVDGGIVISPPETVLGEITTTDDGRSEISSSLIRGVCWDLVVVDDSSQVMIDKFSKGLAALWYEIPNAPVVIYKCASIDASNWMHEHPLTTIVKSSDWDSLEHSARHTIDFELKDDPNIIPETLNTRGTPLIKTVPDEGRKMAEEIEEFIKTINVDQIWQDDQAPLYDRIIRLLLAVGYDFCQKESDNDGNNLKIRIRLPSEETIAKVLRVSRVTSRRAFEELRSVALVDRSYRGSYMTMDNELYMTLRSADIHGDLAPISNVDVRDTERIGFTFSRVSQIWPDYRDSFDIIVANPPYGGARAQASSRLKSDGDRDRSNYIDSRDLSRQLPVMDEAHDIVNLSRALYLNILEKIDAIQKENVIRRKEIDHLHFRLLNLET